MVVLIHVDLPIEESRNDISKLIVKSFCQVMDWDLLPRMIPLLELRLERCF
jgi:hypothetical protein